jgi:hypothetical protein
MLNLARGCPIVAAFHSAIGWTSVPSLTFNREAAQELKLLTDFEPAALSRFMARH